jgi:hypothetical protein
METVGGGGGWFQNMRGRVVEEFQAMGKKFRQTLINLVTIKGLFETLFLLIH